MSARVQLQVVGKWRRPWKRTRTWAQAETGRVERETDTDISLSTELVPASLRDREHIERMQLRYNMKGQGAASMHIYKHMHIYEISIFLYIYLCMGESF